MYCLLILTAEGNEKKKNKQLSSLTGKMINQGIWAVSQWMCETSRGHIIRRDVCTCARGMSDWLTVAGGLSEFWCYTKGKEKQS